jgi:subtilisin family serine protease
MATFVTLATARTPAPFVAGMQSIADMPAAEQVPNIRHLAEGDNVAPLDAQGRRLYVVRLAEPSLAMNMGGIAGLAPTSPAATGARRLDTNAPASQAYLNFLSDRHAEVLRSLTGELRRVVEPVFTYLNVLNAMAVSLTPEEAARAERLPGVRSVTPDRIMEIETDVGPERIGAPTIWEGNNLPEIATRGEGTIVGILDSGINSNHPAFAATDMDGYTHTNPYGTGNFVGACVNQPALCNDKLIGAWNYLGFASGPEDQSGHGSHVASTAAGNRHVAELEVDGHVHLIEISGVAPRANLISYRVCDWFCPQTGSVAAINQAIDDGVDVLNYSISGYDSPWQDIVDQAFLDAFAANIFVASSAGNSGPAPGTVAKTGPWNVSVAASAHPRLVASTLHLNNGPQNLPALQAGGPAMTSDYLGTLRWAGDVDAGNVDGCQPFPANSFAGQAALIVRGNCFFARKINHAAAAGADFVVIYNNLGGAPVRMDVLGATDIPSVMVGNLAGADLIIALDGGAEAIYLDVTLEIFYQESFADYVAVFSARGPSQYDLMAPTIAAPGTGVLAAGREQENDPNHWFFGSGTSMSSPHSAGAGALLRALYPDLSPAEIRSALALSANLDRLGNHALSPSGPLDQGSGFLDLQAASKLTLVMDETAANFHNANPDAGGDPRTLNVPHLVDRNCIHDCTWTRSVTHIGSTALAYQVEHLSPAGMDVTVAPASFTLEPGHSQTLTIEVDVDRDLLPTDDWAFAQIMLEPVDVPTGLYATARMPVVIGPFKDSPVLTLNHESMASTQVPDRIMRQTLTIGNVGAVDLQWSASDGGDWGCSLPDWLQVEQGSGTVKLLQQQTVNLRFNSAGLAEGTYTGHFCLATNDPDASQLAIPAELTVINPPRMKLDPSSFSFELMPEASADEEFVVSNMAPSGDHELEWLFAGSEILQEGIGQAFAGYFDINNWTLENSPSQVNGHFSIEPTPPMEVFITGGNPSVAGHTQLSVEIPIDGTITFDWGYQSNHFGCLTVGSYVINQTLMPLACSSLLFFEESAVVRVSAGDIFAFRVSNSYDDWGVGVLGVTNFKFIPDHCDPLAAVNWLSASPESGTTAQGESDAVLLNVDTSGLDLGQYGAALCVWSNDPFSDLISLPVWLNVRMPDSILHDRFEIAPDP